MSKAEIEVETNHNVLEKRRLIRVGISNDFIDRAKDLDNTPALNLLLEAAQQSLVDKIIEQPEYEPILEFINKKISDIQAQTQQVFTNKILSIKDLGSLRRVTSEVEKFYESALITEIIFNKLKAIINAKKEIISSNFKL